MAAGDDFTPSDSGTTDTLEETLSKAQQALKLDTGRLDDPRIKKDQPFQPAPEAKTPPPPTPVPTPQKTGGTPWLDRGVSSQQKGIATTFATPGDIEAYREAKARGKTEEQALLVGDNGIGSAELGNIATPKVYGVAVPESKLTEIFGYDPAAWRKARAVITTDKHDIVVPIVDLGPGEKAKSRGVVTDYTDLLGKALGAKGFDSTNLTIIKNAGPDYLTERDSWNSEQKLIKKSLGISEPWLEQDIKPKNKTQPWLDNAVAAPKSDKPWLGAPVAKHPIAQVNGLDAFSFIRDMWNSSSVADAQIELGRAKGRVTLSGGPNDPFTQQIQDVQISPDYTPQQKQAIIQQIQDKQRQEKDGYRAQVVQAEAKVKETTAELMKNQPNKWAQILGSAGPYFRSGLFGPGLGTFAAAEQATAETYGDVLTAQQTQLKKIHPDWSDEKILAESVAAASESARASGVSMLALGLVDVPVAGPIISRIVKKLGIGVATMEIANTFAEAQKNIAMKQHGDPSKDILDGLTKLDFYANNAVSGALFTIPGALGEFGRPSAKPIEERIGQARAAIDAQEEAKVQPGAKAEPVEETGEVGPEAIPEKAPAYALAKIKEPVEQLELEVLPEGGRTPPPGREDLTPPGQIPERDINRGLDLPASQAFIPMRDVIENSPHTEALTRGIDEYRAIIGDLLGQHSILDQRLKQLKRENPDFARGMFEGRRGEMDYIGAYIEDAGHLPEKYSPEADEWIRKGNQGLYRKIGDLARSIGMKVFNPITGKWELFIGAPKDVIPLKRRMRPDVQSLLAGKLVKGEVTDRPYTRDDLVPKAQELYDEGTRTINKNTGEPFFSKPEDLLAWGRQYGLEKQNHSLASIERKRVAKYPTFFYTYSPEAMMDSMYWQIHEIARIMAFGQRTDVDKDLFQTTIDAINGDMGMSKGHKERTVEAIQALADDVHGRVKSGDASRFFGGLTSRLAASVHTSSKIGVSLPFMSTPYTGVVNELRGVLRSIFNRADAMDEIRREGLASNLALNIYDDPYTARTRLKNITRVFSGELRAALHGMVYDQGRMATYHAARLKLEQMIRQFQRDPALLSAKSREYRDMVNAVGMNHQDFLKPEISEDLKRRFARELTNDIQTSYRHEDYPSWANTPGGRVMFRFGHWSYNAANVLARYIGIPMAKAVAKGDWTLAGRYGAQLFGTFLASSVASSEAWRWVDDFFFGRQNHAATVGEIMKRLHQNDPEGFSMVQDRLWQDIIGSPLLGVGSDLWQMVQGIARGEIDTVHTFNPFIPPTIGLLGSLIQSSNNLVRQGGRLSDKQLWDLTYQWGTIIRGYYDLGENVLAKAGVALPGHAEAEGHREYNFVRNRVDLFYRLHPEAPGKAQHIVLGGGGPHTPYLQNISEALLSGNVQRAKDEIHKYHVEQKLTDKQLRTSVEDSVKSHKPIPPGQAGKEFIHWARKAMPDDEWDRMLKIEKKYIQTAREAGIPINE